MVKDEGVHDTDGTVYALEDARQDGEQEASQEAMAGFGQVSYGVLKIDFFLTELLRCDVEGYFRMVLLVVSEFEFFSLEM